MWMAYKDGIELLTLPLKPDFWRVSGSSTVLRECPTPGACNADTPRTVCGDTIVARSGGMQWPALLNATAASCVASADNLCAEHHTGPLCLVCEEGFYQPTKGSLCTRCGGAGSLASYSITGGLVLALVGALLAWLYVRRLRRRRAADDDAKLDNPAPPPVPGRMTLRQALWRRLCSDSLRNKFRLVISLFQIVGSFDVVFDVPCAPHTLPPPSGIGSTC